MGDEYRHIIFTGGRRIAIRPFEHLYTQRRVWWAWVWEYRGPDYDGSHEPAIYSADTAREALNAALWFEDDSGLYAGGQGA